MGDLTIDYDERLVSLAGRPVELTAIEYRTLAELSANAGHRATLVERLKAYRCIISKNPVQGGERLTR